MTDIKELVSEAYGMGDLYTRDYGNSGRTREQQMRDAGNNRPSQDYQTFLRKFTGRKQLVGAQQIIKNRIVAKQDTYVSLPPSAGKTFPIVEGLLELTKAYLDSGRTNGSPMLLFVVPTKQLASQIANKDFVEDIVYKLFSIDHGVLRFGNIILGSGNPRDFNSSEAIKIIKNLIGEVVGGSNKDIRIDSTEEIYRRFGNIKPFVVTTYEPAKDLIKDYGNRISHVIIDELQEFFPKPTATSKFENEKKFLTLMEIIKYVKIGTSLTLMTGTINNETSKLIVDNINRKFNRKLEMVPRFNAEDDQTLNRSNIVVQSLQNISGGREVNVQNRIKLCQQIIATNQYNSLMIIYNKGESGQGILRLIKELMRLIPPKPENYFTGRRKATMDEFTDSDFEKVISTEFNSLKRFNIQNILKGGSGGDDYTKNPVDDSENNILYQGVLRGVAPLIGAMDQTHKRVVQKLFVDRKINLILATDAVNVGANVKCRFLYLPTTTKFNGKRLERIDESSLTQLIHRAGRGSFGANTGFSKFGGNVLVYSGIENIDYIQNLVFNDPRSAVPEIKPNIINDLFTSI